MGSNENLKPIGLSGGSMDFSVPLATQPRSRLVLLLGLVALVAAGFTTWRVYASPDRAWDRAIHGADLPLRSDRWARLRRDKTIRGLDRLGTIRAVYASVDDPDPSIRLEAVATLPSIDPDPIDAITRIAGRLGDSDVSVRTHAAAALGEIVHRDQPGRDQAIQALATALKDPEAAVRRAAVSALGQVVFEGGPSADPLRSGRGDDPALDLVAAHLRDDDLAVKIESAYVLACNDRGGQAVPDLAAYLRDQPVDQPPSYLADRAFLAMMVLAVHSDPAAAFLADELAFDREGYPDRPRDALAWSARQSPEARLRVKRLAVALLDPDDPSLRHNAAILLHEIGSDQPALPALIDALGDDSVDIRIRAVEALADLGDTDPTIVPALQACRNDSSREVRERASAALEAIEWAALMADPGDSVP